MNDKLRSMLDAMECDIDMLTEPTEFKTRKEMGDMFTSFIGYDPTRFWDEQLMYNQFEKLSTDDNYNLTNDELDSAIDNALDHYDAVKSNLMLQVAQKTVKEMFGKEVTSDDLNLDLDYLMNSEIFGTGYEDDEEDIDDDEEDDDSSLLDELNDDDDEIEGMDDDEDELTD